MAISLRPCEQNAYTRSAQKYGSHLKILGSTERGQVPHSGPAYKIRCAPDDWGEKGCRQEVNGATDPDIKMDTILHY